MKKYLPIFLFILGFIGFLITQLGIEKTNEIVKFSRAPNSVRKKFETSFKTLKLKTIDNREIDLASVDIPIVILNFWAPWCGPCIEEFPSLNALRKKYSEDEVLILGITSEDGYSPKELKRVIEENNLSFPVVLDSSGEFFNLFDISAIPSTIIFHKGKILEISKEPLDFEAIEFIEKLDKLLNRRLALSIQG
jgi:thiol-disulfide isomerase/thioredoxin